MHSNSASPRKRPVVFPLLMLAVLASAQCALSQGPAPRPAGVRPDAPRGPEAPPAPDGPQERLR